MDFNFAADDGHVEPALVTRRVAGTIEWPTIGIALACWGGFFGLLVVHDRLPWPLVVIGFAVLAGWYMSLQHEVLHGHPTPWHALNVAMVVPPLSLWLPYSVYRDSHLLHHRSELTVPGVDPETFYVHPDTWASASWAGRSLLRANRTLVGRMTVGPAIALVQVARSEWARARRDRRVRMMWMRHLAGAAAVAWVVLVVAGVPAWQYLLGYGYFGVAVTNLRSFVEHRAVADPELRSAVVTSGWFFGILFLFNNLHHTHHALPGAPWYRLPGLTDDLDATSVAARGAGWYRGYGQIVRRYAFRPISDAVFPLAETIDRR